MGEREETTCDESIVCGDKQHGAFWPGDMKIAVPNPFPPAASSEKKSAILQENGARFRHAGDQDS
jgi:hypothetical protein